MNTTDQNADQKWSSYLQSNNLRPSNSTSAVDSIDKLVAQKKYQQESKRNALQSFGGMFLDPIAQTGERFGEAVGVAGLKGANALTAGAVNDFYKSHYGHTLDEAIEHSQEQPRVLPVLNTPITPADEDTPEQIGGRALSTVALGAKGLALGGAAFGAGGAMQQNKDIGGVALDSLATAVGAKVLGFGIQKLAPVIISGAQKFGAPFVEKVSALIPESSKSAFNKLVSNIPDIGKVELFPKPISNAINATNEKLSSIAEVPFNAVSIDAIRGYGEGLAKSGIQKDITDLLASTKGLGRAESLAGQKGTNIKQELSDPSVFKGIQVKDGKINPDNAVTVVDNRIDTILNAKKEMLPMIDKVAPETPKDVLRDNIIKNVKGKYLQADEDAIIKSIDQQLDALPDSFKASELDFLRARARAGARNAKGLQKSSSEYAAIENGARDTLFDVTDNLPLSGSKEYKALNDYVKNMIIVKDFLDTTLRNQSVKGGRTGRIIGRVIGAVAGTTHGPLGTIAGSEVGGTVADILTNNQLGSSMKMALIRNITDDPAMIHKAEELLGQLQNMNFPLLPAGTSGARSSISSGDTINLPAKGNTNARTTFPAQERLESQTKNTIKNTTPTQGIKPSLPQSFMDVKTERAELLSSGHDYDAMIKSGDIPKSTVFKADGSLQPAIREHVVSDLAGKLDQFQKGLGAEFTKIAKGSKVNELIKQAEDMLPEEPMGGFMSLEAELFPEKTQPLSSRVVNSRTNGTIQHSPQEFQRDIAMDSSLDRSQAAIDALKEQMRPEDFAKAGGMAKVLDIARNDLVQEFMTRGFARETNLIKGLDVSRFNSIAELKKAIKAILKKP